MKQRRREKEVESLLATTVSSEDANFLVATCSSLEARGTLLLGLSKGIDKDIASVGEYVAVNDLWTSRECSGVNEPRSCSFGTSAQSTCLATFEKSLALDGKQETQLVPSRTQMQHLHSMRPVARTALGAI